jgi:hypothetical protein
MMAWRQWRRARGGFGPKVGHHATISCIRHIREAFPPVSHGRILPEGKHGQASPRRASI